ncbi:pectinesterase-like [Impatiens glandulifera]|uniref:pectinesterase-like n=1 Tax=Impatiens glandulifera TaxID=253017 RepID=UPI001FB12EA4|nr:pectinesterase-like [Impatiens glandulifera]
MGSKDGSKKGIVILGVSSLLLVAMVIAVTVGVSNSGGDDDESSKNFNHQDITASAKAVQSICQPTEYKEACEKSLSGANTTDGKELVQIAFQAAKKMIMEASENSTLLNDLKNDPRTKQALDNCKELADTAAMDLQRSFDHMSNVDEGNFDTIISNLKIWLSGALTYQQTCLDGFEGTNGDAGEKMQQFLKIGMQLTSNGLSMMDEIAKALASLNLQGVSRRLLSDEDFIVGHGDIPYWVEAGGRRLLQTTVDQLKPNLVVAKDGSGDFTNISDALKTIPRNGVTPFVLYIKEGIYHERVQFDRNLTHLVVFGDGPKKTRITGSLNWVDGVSTFNTASAVVLGDYFIAKDIGFENSAGAEKHQAVALRVGSDMSIFYNCIMDGYQDTLYSHTYRQYYRDCEISGTIDFIFGDSASMFQNCTMKVRMPLSYQANIVTAQGRKEPRQPTGIVLQDCKIVADAVYYPERMKIKSYLARPWKEYSRTVIMESFIDDLISSDGYLPWNGTYALETCYYVEYNNRGPGSSKANRVVWPGIKEVTKKRIQHFTASSFLDASSWLAKTGIPYYPNLVFTAPSDTVNAKDDDEEPLPTETNSAAKNSYESSVKDPGGMSSAANVISDPTSQIGPIAAPVSAPASAPVASTKPKSVPLTHPLKPAAVLPPAQSPKPAATTAKEPFPRRKGHHPGRQSRRGGGRQQSGSGSTNSSDNTRKALLELFPFWNKN